MGRAFPSLILPPPPLLRSDLALRNCLLTSDLTVRIGDYGLAHSNYKVGSSVRVSVRVDQYVSPADLLTPPAPRKTTI